MVMTKPAKGTATRERRKKHRVQKAKETSAMKAARTRDKVCRFPLCPCKKLRLRLEVAHQVHRGMGGNPAGDRTTTAGLVLLCFERHQGRTSLHSGDVRWVPLGDRGADGLIRWEYRTESGEWKMLASEIGHGRYVTSALGSIAIVEKLKDELLEAYR